MVALGSLELDVGAPPGSFDVDIAVGGVFIGSLPLTGFGFDLQHINNNYFIYSTLVLLFSINFSRI